MYFVSYRGTNQGTYIEASNAADAKRAFASRNGLETVARLTARKIR